LEELRRQYADKSLIPFGKMEDADDSACFDGSGTSGDPRLLYIHAFASAGWEQRGEEANFLAWLEGAAGDHRRFKSC
jgi:hypothetical protein